VILATCIGCLVLATAGLALWYQQTYYAWPGQAASGRVHWCGRDYENSVPAVFTWQQIAARTSVPVRPVGGYPPLGPQGQLYAALTPSSQRNSVSPPLPCSMVVYLRTGQNQYRSYSLLGGP
jgi:hypothetical protein